jgi:hypothetical protein
VVIKLIIVHHTLVYSFALIESDSKPIAFDVEGCCCSLRSKSGRREKLACLVSVKLILVHHCLVYSFALIESNSKRITFQDSNSTAGL